MSKIFHRHEQLLQILEYEFLFKFVEVRVQLSTDKFDIVTQIALEMVLTY